MTPATRAVLEFLLRDPAREYYGREICAVTGHKSGVVNPILSRMHGSGWLERRWEDERDEDAHESRARRRFYRLTGPGQEQARQALVTPRRPHRPAPRD